MASGYLIDSLLFLEIDLIPISKKQNEVVKSILKDWEENPIQILAWYTGSGKTNIFLEICRILIKKNPNIRIGISCYLQKNIKHQTSKRADLFVDSHEVILAGRKVSLDNHITIFNPQTLYLRKPTKAFDVLIIDEAHIGGNYGTKYFDKIISDHCKDGYKLLGVTATPWDIIDSNIFLGAKVHSRGLDKGLHEDGRITDFNINIEKVSVKARKSDYSRNGELRDSFLKKHLKSLEEFAVYSVKGLLNKRADKIGEKCLIILPPGDECRIARSVSKSLGKESLVLVGGNNFSGRDYESVDEEEIIKKFRTDPKYKYLCVVNKCQIGFDMPELTSTIDLTMTKNISVLIQRWGRLARKSDSKKIKNYFYMVPSSIGAEEAEWLMSLSVKYAMGEWEGHEGKNRIKFTRAPIFGLVGKDNESSFSFSKISRMVMSPELYNHKVISFSEESLPSGHWGIENLKNEALKYKDRTELSVKNRYVYNILLRKYPKELNTIFPIKHMIGKWNEESATNQMLMCKTKNEFRRKHSGAYDWFIRNGKIEKINENFYGRLRNTIKDWNWNLVKETALKRGSFLRFCRNHKAGHEWCIKHGKVDELKNLFIMLKKDKIERRK